jgi:hypothetical protein
VRVVVALLVVGASAGCNCGDASRLDAGAIAVTLDGTRWELPCVGAHTGDGCTSAPRVSRSLVLGGDPQVTYDVQLRFRGVVEWVTVDGGVGTGPFRVGGQAEQTGFNIYSLEVEQPPTVYFLNAGGSGPRRTFPLEETHTLPMRGGTHVTITGDPVDGAEIINRDGDGGTNVIPGIPPAPLPFDGQFLQVDVVSVTQP